MERESTIPLYYRIAETVKGRIESREYRAGDLIPSDRELAGEFGVSNITIRKAMGLLMEDGFVVRRRGVGTRVVQRGSDRLAIRITGDFRDWFDSVTGRSPRLEVEVLDIRVVECPESIQRLMRTSPLSLVWRMKRVRKFHGEPISYYINYGPPELVHRVKAEDFRRRSFIEVLQERCGIKLKRVEQRVEATVADMDVSSILGVAFGEPLFFVENAYYSDGEDPAEVTHMYYRGDRYVYQATILLEGPRRSNPPRVGGDKR